MGSNTIGRWAFIIGLVLAVLAGLLFDASWVAWVLVVLGVLIGFLNVTGTEAQGFLIAALAFGISATALQSVPFIGEALTAVLANVATLVSGAMIVVATKALFETGRM